MCLTTRSDDLFFMATVLFFIPPHASKKTQRKIYSKDLFSQGRIRVQLYEGSGLIKTPINPKIPNKKALMEWLCNRIPETEVRKGIEVKRKEMIAQEAERKQKEAAEAKALATAAAEKNKGKKSKKKK